MSALNLLLKEADSPYNDGTVAGDIEDGYYTMGRVGAIPALALASLGIAKGKGAKQKALYGLAGAGAGFAGTFAGKAGLDAYKNHKEKQREKIMAEMQAGAM